MNKNINNILLSANLVFYEVKKAHIGTVLGFGWAVMEPLMFLATYYLLFVVILKVSYDGPGGSVGHLISMIGNGACDPFRIKATVNRSFV